jgi:hypothetical protein
MAIVPFATLHHSVRVPVACSALAARTGRAAGAANGNASRAIATGAIAYSANGAIASAPVAAVAVGQSWQRETTS